MTERTHTRLLMMLVLATGLAGCEKSLPVAPSPDEPLIQQPFQQTVPPSGGVPGTLTLAGTVRDAAWRPLPGARVEVVDGPQAGLSTTSDAKGDFRLTGTFDATTHFRATTDGYVAVTRPFPESCAACNPNWWIIFTLETVAPGASLAGEYILTFVANPSCANLPDEARTRTYGATITPAEGSRFDVRVSSPTILPSFNRFTIGVAGDYLGFEIGDPGHSGAGLVEQVAPNRYVALNGAVAVFVTDASTIAAPLNGAVYVCELPGVFDFPYNCGGPGGVERGGCHSQNHQLILRRREQ